MSGVLPSSGEITPSSHSSDGATPVTLAARAVLCRRGRKAVRLISRATCKAPADAETVHELRVAIRRYDAALATFAPFLPEHRIQRVRKLLRRVRRAAGDVRDLDVLRERLFHNLAVHVTPGDADDLSDARDRRWRKLRHTSRAQLNRRLKRRTRRVVEHVRWPASDGEPTLAVAARDLLRPMAESCQAEAAADFGEVRNIHQFRVSVKRLRYACEFLQGGLDDAAANSLTTRLAELQQRFGDVCDHASAIRLLDSHAEHCRNSAGADPFATIRQVERDALTARQAELIAWWNADGRAVLDSAIDTCMDQQSTAHHLPDHQIPSLHGI